jgi:serine/threonine protein kinase
MRLGFVGGEHAIRSAEAMAVREVDSLQKLASHPGVISLQAAFYSPATQQIFIVTDFLPGSHLFSHVVQRTNPLQENETSHIMAQVSDALHFCHSLGVVHRDLKLENILVASVNVSLAEHRAEGAEGHQISWKTQELFTVKICDFGFAKSLQGFTTRTPIGTSTYAAPEVDLDAAKERRKNGLQEQDFEEAYDAFKADAYSLGVMMFVMLCLAFPVKDGGAGSHRSHKLWPTLSADARFLLDGLLEFDPKKRLSLVQVCEHHWVMSLEDVVSPRAIKRRKSKKEILEEAEREWDDPWETSLRSPEPRWRCAEDPVLPSVLALHRALVHIQQERSMALWALTGTAGLDGISSCWDQFQWHIELTEKRLHEAKDMLQNCFAIIEKHHQDETLVGLASHLTRARQLSHSMVPHGTDETGRFEMCGMSLDSFDAVFASYGDACRVIIEKVARCVENSKPSSSESRRAARRYRLFSSAAEQLSRERAFMCGHRRLETQSGCNKIGLSREMLQRLSEIIGSRKILLGTAVSASYTVATSTGLLGGLIGEGEPTLLSTADIVELERLEARVLVPSAGESLPTEEWYRTLTRLLNEIHSRIAVGLVDDMRLPELHLFPSDLDVKIGCGEGSSFLPCVLECSRQEQPSESDGAVVQKACTDTCGCREGLKKILKFCLDKL